MTTGKPDQDSLLQNIAAISAEFHTHPRYGEVYEILSDKIGGFVGIYDICIDMAQALTAWEADNGGGLVAYEYLSIMWIEVVAQYVDTMISRMIEVQLDIEAPACLRELPILNAEARRRK